LDWYQTIFELIDIRSFSSLWFWIMLAVVWSMASHWVVGIPYGMVTRARHEGGQSAKDLQDMILISINRRPMISPLWGMSLLSLICFGLTALVVLGFVYRVETAQALFLLGFPLSLVWALNLSTARSIIQEQATGPALYKRLTRLRAYVRAIGIVAIFVTALWGMYQNMVAGPFGL